MAKQTDKNMEHPDRLADLAQLASLQQEHDSLTRSLGAKGATPPEGVEPDGAQQRLAVVTREMDALRKKHHLTAATDVKATTRPEA